jgi:dTDP-4-dehydrorhamnose reductase
MKKMLAKHKYNKTLSRRNEWFIEPTKLIQTAKAYSEIVNKSKFVYFLISNNEIVYVGLSDVLQSRLHKHTKDKDFDKVAWIRVKADDQKYIEAFYISTLKPKYNKFIPIREYGPNE